MLRKRCIGIGGHSGSSSSGLQAGFVRSRLLGFKHSQTGPPQSRWENEERVPAWNHTSLGSSSRYSPAWRYGFRFLYELYPTARRFSDDLWSPLENGTNVKGCHMILTPRFQSQCFAEFWWSCSFENACLDMKGFHRQRNLWELFWAC